MVRIIRSARFPLGLCGPSYTAGHAFYRSTPNHSSPVPTPIPPAANATLYVRLPNWIGDVCMSLPSLDALLATGLPVVACARPWARALLADYPLQGLIDMQSGWLHNAKAVRQSMQDMDAAHRRLGLLLPDSLSSALTFRLAGIPCAGYRDDGRGLLLRWPVKKPPCSASGLMPPEGAFLPWDSPAVEKPPRRAFGLRSPKEKPAPLHTVASWYFLTRQALTAWRLPVPDRAPPPRLDLRLHVRHHADARAVLAAQRLPPGGFILIAPTATGLHHGKIKVWPHFDALTRQLQAAGHTVAMCPPPAEVQAARANAPTALCLPPLDLGAFAALTAMAALVICNDSGVSHLAAAVRARQLTLIGVTNAAHTGPWSSQAVCLGEEGRWPTLAQVLEHAKSIADHKHPD